MAVGMAGLGVILVVSVLNPDWVPLVIAGSLGIAGIAVVVIFWLFIADARHRARWRRAAARERRSRIPRA